MRIQLHEAKLISEQVNWLLNLSESLVKNVQKKKVFNFKIRSKFRDP